MRIQSIRVYRVAMPVPNGIYKLSGGRFYTEFDNTVVGITADTGLVGWGEICTLGADYLPAFGRGARAVIAELAPHLLGEDPRRVERVNRLMDRKLLGHPYAKAALDMACWDLLGKAVDLPLCDLLGGRVGGGTPALSGVSTGSVDEMIEVAASYRKKGYRCQSIKLGGDPAEDVQRIRGILKHSEPGEEFHADCNRGWTGDQAMRVMHSVRDLDIYFEQPCATYEECLAVRRRTDHPMILDEIIDGPEMILRIVADRAADLVNIKISRVGGLTKARRVRDICVAAGLPVTIQDTGGGGLTQAAILHLAQSTPEELRRSVYDPLDYASHPLTDAPVQAKDGRLEAPDGVGLGQMPIVDLLGDPIAVYET